MNAHDLKDHLMKGDVRAIDIREAEELESIPAIEGTEHIAMGKFFTEVSKGNIDKNDKIVLICKSGGRCSVVAREFGAKGFDIDYLEGGMKSWNELDSE